VACGWASGLGVGSERFGGRNGRRGHAVDWRKLQRQALCLVCLSQPACGRDWNLGNRSRALLNGRACSIHLDYLGPACMRIRDQDGHVAAHAFVPAGDGHSPRLLGEVVDDDLVVVVFRVRVGAIVGRQVLLAGEIALLQDGGVVSGGGRTRVR